MNESEFQMNYITNCGWQDFEHAWSGTYISLFRALNKKVSLSRIDVGISRNEWYVDRVASKLLYRNDFRGFAGKVEDRRLYNKRLSDQNNLYMFGPFLKRKERNSWMYIDLTVGYLLHCIENDPELFAYSNFNSMSLDRIKEWNKRQIETFSYLKGVFTMSHWLHDYLEKEKVCKVVYAGGGINCDISLKRETKKEHKNIFFAGREFQRKGGELVLQAFEILQEKMPDAHLYIAGGYEKESINKAIHFLGDISKEEMAYYYNMCDIFCMPSYFEAYGIVVIEALMYGLPVIAKNNFEMPSFIEDEKTGYLLKNNDSKELANAMYRLLNNSQYVNEVNKKYEDYRRTYSWDRTANIIIEEMYEEKNRNCM